MTAEPSKDDWDTMLAALESAFAAAGILVPFTLARRVVEMIKRHWTEDGKLAPEYRREKALQIVEEAIDPLAGAHLAHAEDLEQLKRGQAELTEGQDQIVTLMLRVLRELEARRGPSKSVTGSTANGTAPFISELQSVYLICGNSDTAVAERLRSDLNTRGVETYFFAIDALPGARRQRHQHREIGAHDRVAFCCSKDALQDRDVIAQVEEALEREHEEGASEVLIPLVIGGLKFEQKIPSWWPRDKEHIHGTLRRRAPLILPNIGEPGWDSAVARLVTALRVMGGEE